MRPIVGSPAFHPETAAPPHNETLVKAVSGSRLAVMDFLA